MFAPTDHTFAVCAYKESPYLEACIQSVVNQSVEAKVILCTSTPNDYIRDLAEKFNLELFISKEPSSISNDWNFALSCVETPLATLAHQDDVYLPAYSEALVRSFNNATDPLIFFCDYAELRGEVVVSDNEILRVKRRLLKPLEDPSNWNSIKVRRKALSLGCPICCPSVSFNLERLERPIFRSNFSNSLDWDTWERLSKLDGAFVFDPEILMYHRVHEESETSNMIQSGIRAQEDREMLRRFWPKPVAAVIARVYQRAQKSNDLS